MAEKRSNGRGHRRAWSILSLAGTATAIWAGTGLGGDGRPTAKAMSAEAGAVGVTITEATAAAPLDLALAPAQARSDEGAAMSVLPEAAAQEALPTPGPTPATPAAEVAGSVVVELAPAVTATMAPPSGTEATGQAALARISYPWQSVLAGWSIEFLDGRAGLLGGTYTYEKRIEIYVRPEHTVDEVAFTLAHELGHAVDVTLLSEAERNTWRTTRGIGADAPWWVESGATDFSSVSGDWAESFAVWQVGGSSHSRLGGQPSAQQVTVMSQLAS
jgi:hypothetical protein